MNDTIPRPRTPCSLLVVRLPGALAVLALELAACTIASVEVQGLPAIYPRPEFGLTEHPPLPPSDWSHELPGFYFVDADESGATDSGREFGRPGAARASIPLNLPAGSRVDVRGKTLVASGQSIRAYGTRENPVFVVGEGVARTIFHGTEMTLCGHYLIVDGITWKRLTGPLMVGDETSHHLVLRACAIVDRDGRSGAAIGVQGTQLVIAHSKIADNGPRGSDTEADLHGIKPSTGDSFHWYLENEIHGNSGDGIQVGSARAQEPKAHHIFIVGNHIYNDRENAVDIKQARQVLVANNIIHGYIPTASSAGEAIVVHNEPEDVWIVNNTIFEATRGIVSTGVGGHLAIVGNVIHHIANQAIFPDRGGGQIHVLHNTVVSSGAGLVCRGRLQGLEIRNNIFSGVPSPAIFIRDTKTRSVSEISHNLESAHAPATSGETRMRRPRNDPRFVAAERSDYRLEADSPAIGEIAEMNTLVRLFGSTFDASLMVDVHGTPRAIDGNGAGGACSCPSPTN